MPIRGLTAALNASNRFKLKDPEGSVDFLVVGGGVIGLAIAERLCKLHPEKYTYVVERNACVGEEISSRNSEVIHAGIYYPPKSLKATSCIRGRQLLYARCQDYIIPYKKIGKLVVAGKGQKSYLEKIVSRVNTLPLEHRPPLELIHGTRAREMQPDLSPNIESALYSPETGIIDSHALMRSFEKEISDSGAGSIVCSTRVVRVDPYKGSGLTSRSGGWVVQTLTSQNDRVDDSKTDAFLAKVLINASGLNAHLILNSLLPRESAIPMYYARGSYASYRGAGVSTISKLIYPVPELTKDPAGGSDPSNFQSLGTHLTLDMSNSIRFGPDIEWLTPPHLGDQGFETEEGAVDFWKDYLRPDEQKRHIQEMHRAITTYLPNVALSGLQPDYVGIRPKLVPPTSGFYDFRIRMDPSHAFGGSGDAPMITLLGIESPGLTASLAIAETVTDRLKSTGITQ